ncbi:unnamed protein product [Merluccius merluccius]
MSHPSTLDLDRYSSMNKTQTRRSTTTTHAKTRSLSRGQAKTGDVMCDFCTRKERAALSCLVCQASFCEDHVQTHYEYPALMKHKLVKATGQMREKLCAQHDKLLEAYCRTDNTSVCVLCMMDEHKHHDTVPAGTERTEKQKQLGNTLHKSQQRIDGRVKKWQDLRQAVESVKHSAQTASDENERIFTEILRSVERKFTEVREMIETHEKITVSRAEILLDRLEEEITLMRKKHNDLEKLSHTDDHIHFLQSWQALSGPSGYEDLNNVVVAPNYSFEAAKRAIASLKREVEEASKAETSKISAAGFEPRREPQLQQQQQQQPRTRQDFMKYSLQVTLDSNTVHSNLHLSDGNRTATMVQDPKKYSSHPDRFDQWQQVLSRESVSSGRHYWEVDWRGTETDIAVTYRGIRRKGSGNECSLGWNEQSWSLYCSQAKYSFVHNNRNTDLEVPRSSRVGVYLDYNAGLLAFYSESEGTLHLLHRVQVSFTEPVYPAFSVWGFGSSIKL